MPPKSKAAAAAAAEPVAVEDLFTALHRHIQAGEFPQAVKVADQAPEDEDAVRCKVVAHIKSDATDKALATIRTAERLPIDLSYYKAAAAAPAPAAKEKKAKGKDKEGFKTIEMTEKLNCRSKDIYEILMDENRWKGFTQSNARISREVGGQFNLFDGSITGINEELQEGKVIMQKWRFGSWPGGFTDAQRDILVLRLDAFVIMPLHYTLLDRKF